MFVDYAEIEVAAGSGGNGAVSFHREKFVPKGGPDGGDGGKGGDLFVRASANLSTLLDFRYKKRYKAQNGKPGGKNNMTGESGKPVYIDLPIGTIVSDLGSGRVLADLAEDGKSVLIAKGGKGGKGNSRFKTPTNRAPRKSEPGQPGEKFTISLELKSIADVGLVGFPNAGKSTLLARLSAAHPKIADYPFTTKTPNLGIVPLKAYKSFIMADIPGLIEGAHKGKGMGIKFLRHIQRTRVLVYLLDLSSGIPVRDLEVLKNEVSSFDRELANKPYLTAINKIDLTPERPVSVSGFNNDENSICYISAATGENIEDFLNRLSGMLFKNDR